MLKTENFNIFLFSSLFTLFYLDITSLFGGKLQILKWILLIVLIVTLPITNGFHFSFKKNFILFSFYTIILTLSTFIHSGIDNTSLKYLISYLILYLVYVVYTFSTRDEILTETLTAFYYTSLFFILVSGIFIFSGSAYEGGRFNGVFSNTNALAGIATLFLVILLYKYQDRRTYLSLFLILLTILIIFLTKSRTALATLAILFIIYTIINNKGGLFFKGGLLILILSVIINIQEIFLILANSMSIDGASSEFRSFNNFDNRMLIIERQLFSFINSPIIGVGVVIDRNDIFSRFAGESTYLDLLSMSGILGTTLFFLIIIKNLKLFLYNSHLLFLILLTILLLSIFEGYISNVGSVITLMYWFIIAKGIDYVKN